MLARSGEPLSPSNVRFGSKADVRSGWKADNTYASFAAPFEWGNDAQGKSLGSLMLLYRLQKYDPAEYDRQGYYVGSEWSDVRDVGRAFGGRLFTMADYVTIESAYVEAIQMLMHAAEVRKLRVVADGWPLEQEDDFDLWWSGIDLGGRTSFGNSDWLDQEGCGLFSRLCLRNMQGFALSDGTSFFCYFPGAFYVKIGMNRPVSKAVHANIGRLGLHIVNSSDIAGASEVDSDILAHVLFGQAVAEPDGNAQTPD